MNGANGGTVQYGTPNVQKRAVSEARVGRRCSERGCVTVLSVYNEATTCWLHSTPTRRHALAPERQ
jgi:hypothetical protein